MLVSVDHIFLDHNLAAVTLPRFLKERKGHTLLLHDLFKDCLPFVAKAVTNMNGTNVKRPFGPLSFRLASSGGFNPVGGQHEDLFKVLGVSHSASEDQIRDAFRQAAKKCHPDLHSDPKAAEQFRRCLLAYQVLMNGESRQYHAMCLKSSTMRRVRAAASPRTSNTDAVLTGLGGAQWRRQAAKGDAAEGAVARHMTGVLGMDRLADELEESLQQVVSGTSLEGLAEGQLPSAFEAEHRSWPSNSLDLLQIVSGQTLLGSVRCSTTPLLPGAGHSQHLLEEPHKPVQQESCVSPSSQQQHQLPNMLQNMSNCESSRHGEGGSQPWSLYSSLQRWLSGGRAVSETQSQHWDMAGKTTPINELTFSAGNMDQVKATLYSQNEMKWLVMQCTVSEQVLGYVLGDALTDADGHITHRIVNINTPGVLTTFFRTQASGKVALKASRTWLPHHTYWFVPPRTVEYSTGGWYVENGNGSLHPGIACCLLGFKALEFENGVRVPWWLKRTIQAAQRDVHLLPAQCEKRV